MGKCKIAKSSIHGQGLFVDGEAIAASEQVISEPPLLVRRVTGTPRVQNEAFFGDVQALDEKGVTALWLLALKRNPELKSVLPDEFARRLQNKDRYIAKVVLKAFFAFSHPFSGESTAAVYHLVRSVSLLNHSCLPNAEVHWDEEKNCMTVQATQFIEPGEEILIAYTNHMDVRSERMRGLGFECQCPACTAPMETFNVAEVAKARLAKAFETLHSFRAQYFPINGVQIASPAMTEAIAADPQLQTVVEAANNVINIANDLKMRDSCLGIAYETLYVLLSAIAFVAPKNVAVHKAAFDRKLSEMELEITCIGHEHPRTRETIQQLLFICKGDKHRRDALRARLEPYGMDLVMKCVGGDEPLKLGVIYHKPREY